MRILVVDNVNYTDYPTGGIMSFYRSLLPAFGSDLLLAGICTDGTGVVGRWDKRDINGIEYDYYSMSNVTPSSERPFIPERITNSISIKKHIGRILARNDYDIVLTHKPEVVFFLPDAVLQKTCYILPGIENPLSISRYPWARRLAGLYDRFFLMPRAARVRWLLAAADLSARESFSKRSGGRIQADQVIQFPTRYDETFYHGMNQSDCRQRLNIPAGIPVFVTVGRLGWFKGWQLMIDAFQTVRSQKKDAVLYFIGDGEDEQKIRAYVSSLGLDGAVILTGKQAPEAIGVYLNAADVFVMGSMVEGWSTTLVEACACGVPCVVTDFSSARAMVQDGKNGYVVASRDAKAFARRMTDALAMDRRQVADHDRQYEKYAICHLKEDLLHTLDEN